MVSVALLAMLVPVFAAVALMVRMSLGPPVFFCQARPGRHGRLFVLYKFRSMIQAGDPQDHLLRDGERLTPFGRWLRRTSLDELPEFINVVRGQMSLVGPRPLLVEYLDRYTADQRRRHDVKPGITGWAQVNGRNALPWEEKFARDVWYVDHVSLWLDVKILGRTALTLLRGDGINEPGRATAQEFKGRPDHS